MEDETLVLDDAALTRWERHIANAEAAYRFNLVSVLGTCIEIEARADKDREGPTPSPRMEAVGNRAKALLTQAHNALTEHDQHNPNNEVT